MRQDNDLIRKMILAIEDHPHGFAPHSMEFEGYTEEQVGYHSYLLHDAGLAHGHDVTTVGAKSPEWIVSRLTTKGHEFALAARAEYIWNEVHEDIKAKGLGAVALDLVKQMLDRKIRKKLDE